MDLEIPVRARLYGRKATLKEMVDEMVRLRFNGSLQRRIPMTWNDVARKMGIDRTTVFNYKHVAREIGKIKTDEKGKDIIPEEIKHLQEYIFLDKTEFTKDPLVREWADDLRTRRNDRSVVGWKSKISSLRKLCNTCKINPEQLIVDKKTTEKIIKNFAEHYKNGQLKIKNRKNMDLEASLEFVIHTMVMTVRSFCAFHGLSWPRGTSSIMSGRVIGHGKYPHIHFALKELKKADRFISEKWGTDSDIYRVFWVGVESCSRKTALLNMRCEWIKQTSNENKSKIFVMKAIETKTNYIKNGQWLKYITRRKTQRSLENHKSKNYTYITEKSCNKTIMENQLREQLREIYRHVGKTDEYFYTNPFHSLRHIGAHYWLEKTNYNYGLVAKIGGWHTIDELKNSYGEMSSEFVINSIETNTIA